MEALVIAISPAVVSTLTDWSKKLKTIADGKHRKAILRLIVAVLSLGAAVGSAALSGQVVEIGNIETLLKTVFVAGSTLVTYYFGKKG